MKKFIKKLDDIILGINLKSFICFLLSDLCMLCTIFITLKYNMSFCDRILYLIGVITSYSLLCKFLDYTFKNKR